VTVGHAFAKLLDFFNPQITIMKKVFRFKNTSIFFIVIAVLIGFGCSKDKDLIQADLIGNYTVTETCDGSDDSYEITISSVGSDENTIQIYNLWDWQESVVANINGDAIDIPSQVLDGVTFSGSGSLSGDELTINYSVLDGTDNESCKAVGKKQ
jgi:hypothetical protein